MKCEYNINGGSWLVFDTGKRYGHLVILKDNL